MALNQFESSAKEYQQQSLSLDNILVDHPGATYVCKASDDDMNAYGIHKNDLLIVDRHVPAKQNDIVISNYQGEYICRLLDVRQRLLSSENAEVKPLLIDDIADHCIIGVVIRSVRCFHPVYLVAK